MKPKWRYVHHVARVQRHVNTLNIPESGVLLKIGLQEIDGWNTSIAPRAGTERFRVPEIHVIHVERGRKHNPLGAVQMEQKPVPRVTVRRGTASGIGEPKIAVPVRRTFRLSNEMRKSRPEVGKFINHLSTKVEHLIAALISLAEELPYLLDRDRKVMAVLVNEAVAAGGILPVDKQGAQLVRKHALIVRVSLVDTNKVVGSVLPEVDTRSDNERFPVAVGSPKLNIIEATQASQPNFPKRTKLISERPID